MALFVTCLVDQFFPGAGRAAVEVLEHLGLAVTFPAAQTCCGQPAFNDGFRDEARRVARHFVDTFAGHEWVVAPSASCVAMVRELYGALLAADPVYGPAARALGQRTYELSEFLVNVLGVTDIGARYRARVTFHPSCHLLRGLHAAGCARALLQAVDGLELVPLPDEEQCCGFGGVFSVKFPHLSTAMMRDKLAAVQRTGADLLVSTDVSCLMHLAGGLARDGSPVRTVHAAELLARGLRR